MWASDTWEIERVNRFFLVASLCGSDVLATQFTSTPLSPPKSVAPDQRIDLGIEFSFSTDTSTIDPR